MSNDDETMERVAHAVSGALIAAFKAGWGNSAEGYNAEYGPLDDDVTDTAIEETKEYALIAARAALSAMPPRDELLREALEALTPFASDADLWSGSDSLSLVEAAPGYSDALTVGDLRRARAAADKIRAGVKEGDVDA